MPERRRFHRWPLELSVYLVSERGTWPARTVDLSWGGVALTAPACPAEGEEIILQFEEDPTLVFKARIVYRQLLQDRPEGHAVGVEFYGTPESKRTQLLPLFRRFLGNAR